MKIWEERMGGEDIGWTWKAQKCAFSGHFLKLSTISPFHISFFTEEFVSNCYRSPASLQRTPDILKLKSQSLLPIFDGFIIVAFELRIPPKTNPALHCGWPLPPGNNDIDGQANVHGRFADISNSHRKTSEFARS